MIRFTLVSEVASITYVWVAAVVFLEALSTFTAVQNDIGDSNREDSVVGELASVACDMQSGF